MESGIIEAAAEVAAHPALAAVLAGRAELMRASQANYDAMLAPRDPDGIGHAERLALACRIARLAGDHRLAAHYREALEHDGDNSALAALADPAAPLPAGRRHAAMLRHVDLVTCTPREATHQDIVALRQAGLAEADIVSLAQLIAFMSYQVRVVAGLRLLEDGA